MLVSNSIIPKDYEFASFRKKGENKINVCVYVNEAVCAAYLQGNVVLVAYSATEVTILPFRPYAILFMWTRLWIHYGRMFFAVNIYCTILNIHNGNYWLLMDDDNFDLTAIMPIE